MKELNTCESSLFFCNNVSDQCRGVYFPKITPPGGGEFFKRLGKLFKMGKIRRKKYKKTSTN